MNYAETRKTCFHEDNLRDCTFNFVPSPNIILYVVVTHTFIPYQKPNDLSQTVYAVVRNSCQKFHFLTFSMLIVTRGRDYQ